MKRRKPKSNLFIMSRKQRDYESKELSNLRLALSRQSPNSHIFLTLHNTQQPSPCTTLTLTLPRFQRGGSGGGCGGAGLPWRESVKTIRKICQPHIIEVGSVV